MIDWQPVGTAPEDDRRVLVYGRAIFEVGTSPKQPLMGVAHRWPSTSEGPSTTWSVCDVSGYETMIFATHWAPIAEPQQETTT
jgi:hypothetical protein